VRSLLVIAGVALVSTTGALASTPSPAKLVLRAGQVGPSYLLLPYQEGRTLKRPTLDMCNLKFPSEALRTARDKVVFQRGQNDPTIANEVVTYKAGGAAQALRDARGSVKRCPAYPVKSGTSSITTQIKVLHLHGKLFPGFVALELHVFGVVNKKQVSLDGDALYQAHGNVMSGVYAYNSDPAARVKFMLHAAEQSAKNLSR
jgi:hypothetical protein